jgi:hypothetical protein
MAEDEEPEFPGMRLIDASIAHARHQNNANSLAFALGVAAHISQVQHEPATTARFASEAIEIAREHRLPQWLAAGETFFTHFDRLTDESKEFESHILVGDKKSALESKKAAERTVTKMSPSVAPAIILLKSNIPIQQALGLCQSGTKPDKQFFAYLVGISRLLEMLRPSRMPQNISFAQATRPVSTAENSVRISALSST